MGNDIHHSVDVSGFIEMSIYEPLQYGKRSTDQTVTPERYRCIRSLSVSTGEPAGQVAYSIFRVWEFPWASSYSTRKRSSTCDVWTFVTTGSSTSCSE